MDLANTFDEFKEILKNYEIRTFSKFNVFKSQKGFLGEKRDISENSYLHWKDGLPYFQLGIRVYTCHQGKDKNCSQKRKYMESKQEQVKSDHNLKKNNNLTQPTKKLNCPASIKVIRIYALPQFKLENPTRSQRDATAVKIKKELKNKEILVGEEAFWYALPSVDTHRNHKRGEISAITEPVDLAVRLKIKELVQEGKRNSSVISKLLEIYVKTELKQNDKSQRRFFPDIPTIKGIIKESKREIQHSKIDMENTEKLLEGFDENTVFYWPCSMETINDEVIIINEELDNSEDIDEEGICDIKWRSTPSKNFLRRKLINECDANIRSLSSVLYMLPESELVELKNDLQGLKEKMHKRVKQDGSTGLPMEVEGNKNTDAAKSQMQYGTLKTCAKKGLSGRVEMKAHAMKKARKKIT